LGRMTVEQDQQPGSCRDWYCHAHWVWLHEGTDGGGVLWSGPDTPLFALNDIVRGQWRRKIAPDGTLLAYAMNNYWHTNYAARQGGEYACRFRISLLAPSPTRAAPARRHPRRATARVGGVRPIVRERAQHERELRAA